MITKIKKQLKKLDVHTLEVVKKSGSATIVKMLGMIAGLLVSVALGRILGADGLGIINLSNQIVTIVLVFCMLGTSQVIIKEIAIARNKEKFLRINDIINSAYILNGLVTVFVSVVLILLAPWIANHFFHNEKMIYPLIVFFIVLTPQIFSRIYSAGLVGYQKIWQSNLVDQTMSISITGVLLLIFYLLNYPITVNLVAVLYAIGRVSVTIFVGIYWQKLKPEKKDNGKRELAIQSLLKTGMPLLLVSAALILSGSIDSIMLGWLRNSKEVGIYTVSFRIATLTIFFLQVTTAAISPKIASLYEAGQIGELRKMVQQVTSILTIIGVLSVVLFIFAGKYILSLWGDEFKVGFSALIILSVGQFFNIASGPVGNILAMTNHEKVLRNITVITLLINVVLNFVLIKMYGIIGASIATTFSTFMNMALCYYYVKLKLNI
ncbi:MAG TPA: flippase [Edaphocola sp.]|nr:flippase [Edaphocola sp.]